MGLRDCSGERTETQREIQRKEGEYKSDKEDRDSKTKRESEIPGAGRKQTQKVEDCDSKRGTQQKDRLRRGWVEIKNHAEAGGQYQLIPTRLLHKDELIPREGFHQHLSLSLYPSSG